jgi:carbohydrate diacid regulator
VLTPQLAQSVVDEVTTKIGHKVNIMGPDGVIVASSDRSRVGVLHAGALQVARTRRDVVVHRADPDGSQRPGVNVPLTADGQFLGVVGISGDPGEVGGLAKTVVLLVELLLRQNTLREDEEWRHRVCQHVVADLLQRSAPVEDCLERLSLAGLSVVPPVSVAVLHGPGPTDTTERSLRPLRRLSDSVAAAADRRGRVWTIAFGRSHGTALHAVRAVRDGLVSTGVAPHARVISSPTQDDLHSIAVTVPRLARATLVPPRTDCSIEQVYLHTVLASADHGDRRALLAETLGRVDDVLVATVEAFLDADLNLVATAKALGVHRNTVVYRLGRVQTLTGYDPRRGRDAVLLGVALLLSSMHNDEG